MTSNLNTKPPDGEQGSLETIPWAIDISQDMVPEETPVLLSMTLLDVASGEAYPAGLPSQGALSGTIVIQVVTGLARGHVYDLIAQYRVAADTILTSTLRLRCLQ